jgi:hydrogenase/urease accessory protein HupE
MSTLPHRLVPRWFVALCALLTFTLASLSATKPAFAHAVGLSQAKLRLAEQNLSLEMTLARGEFIGAVPALAGTANDALTVDVLERHRAAIGAAFASGAVFTAQSGERCDLNIDTVRLAEEDGVRMAFIGPCKALGGNFDAQYLGSLSHGHRQMLAIATPEGTRDELLYRGHTKVTLGDSSTGSSGAATRGGAPRPNAEPASRSFVGLFRMGVEHILSFEGYDHLLFLFALVLLGGTFRSLTVVITTFTLAHSVALACAVLGLITPSSRVIEPAIALSIAYVGIENFVRKTTDKRWMLTLAFGFIHGFAFAGALREISLSRAEVPLALFSFNLGVEAGQIGALIVLLPLVLWARKSERFRNYGVRFLSFGIAATGIVLFVQRTCFGS